MTTITFDMLKLARPASRRSRRPTPPRRSQSLGEVSDLATKADLAELKAELKADLRSELNAQLRRMMGTMLGVAALAVAASKLLP